MVNEGSLTVEQGILWLRGSFRQIAGQTRLSNATLQMIAVNNGFQLEGGIIMGTGTINFDTGVGVIPVQNVGGIMNPGTSASAGTLSVTGRYTQSGEGTLALDTFGPPQNEGSFDRLTATRALTLGGRLKIRRAPGFVPEIGAVYPVVTGLSRAGEFGTVTGTEIAADRRFQVAYTAKGVGLRVVSVP